MYVKKILFLGATQQQIPPIKYAIKEGHHVITCDNIPSNPGHTYAHETYNISTTDREGILSLAKSLCIDGIVAYASDPAATTQAYVAQEMGLVGNPLKSVEILSRKDLFREFLSLNGFNTPKSKSFDTIEGIESWLNEIGTPAIIKPVDSSGSKGVSKLMSSQGIETPFKLAMSFSREKRVIIEEFIERENYQIAGDGFITNGKLSFYCWANEHFDKDTNPLVPIGESFPSLLSQEIIELAKTETQRIIDILEIKNGAINFDFHYTKNKELFFIEIGPRNGGNLIPEVIKYSTGVDLVKITVDSALGVDCSGLKQVPAKGYYSSYIIHSTKDGLFDSISYEDNIKTNIVEKNLNIKQGSKVYKFNGSNNALGSLIMKYSSMEEMLHKMDNMNEYIKVNLK